MAGGVRDLDVDADDLDGGRAALGRGDGVGAGLFADEDGAALVADEGVGSIAGTAGNGGGDGEV